MRQSMSRPIRLLSGGLAALMMSLVIAGAAGIYTVDTVRAFATGNALYAEAVRRAGAELQAYVTTGDPDHLARYETAMRRPSQFGLARLILQTDGFNRDDARPFLVDAGMHPDEISMMIRLVRGVDALGLFQQPLETWRLADRAVQRLDAEATRIRAVSLGAGLSPAQRLEAQARALAHANVVGALTTRFAHEVSQAARDFRHTVVGALAALTLLAAVIAYVIYLRTSHTVRAGERSLRETRKKFEDIAYIASDWIWETDADLRFTFVSHRREEITGHPNRHLIGKRPWDLPGNTETQAAWAPIREAMLERRPFREFEHQRTDARGEALWLRASGTPVFADDGTFVGYRGTGTNVTSERRAEHQAAARKILLEGVLEALPVGIAVLSAEHRLAARNTRLYDMLEDPNASCAIGDPVRVALGSAAAPAPSGGEHHTPGGRILEASTVSLPNGGCVVCYHDITAHRFAQADLRAAKEQAERADRAKTQFLASMSHELRTPLNAIIGYSEMMNLGLFGSLDPRYQAYVRDIHNSGRYLLDLIDDVLDLSKLEIDALTLEPHDLDLLATVREALIFQGEGLSARVATDVPSGLKVRMDPRALKQCVVNVVGNALKFSGDAPVRVRAAQNAGRVQLSVVDEGPGIPADEIDRVTQPFYTQSRGPYVASDQREGSGIGLALTKRLVESSGGQLLITSTVNCGTTVTLSLPAAGSARAADTRCA